MTARFVNVLVNQEINNQTHQNHLFLWSASSDNFQKTDRVGRGDGWCIAANVNKSFHSTESPKYGKTICEIILFKAQIELEIWQLSLSSKIMEKLIWDSHGKDSEYN